MNRTETRNMTMTARRWLLAPLLLLAAALALQAVLAAPSGAAITSNRTDNGPTASPAGLLTSRSTITTLVLDAVQQDQHWKAYIGNVTGTLTLDDAANNTIYDWTAVANPSGEVYASRSSTLNFNTVACAAPATIASEQAVMNMTASDSDTISRTFNSTAHTPTVVAGTTLSGCNMTSLYVNSLGQGQTASADYQEFLMQDAASNLVYVAIINDNTVGYNGNTYDFEMIVAESHVQTARTYYFYVELG